MCQHDDSVSVEDEIAPELSSVLSAMNVGDTTMQQGLAVEEDDVGVRVRPQDRGLLQSKSSVGDHARIEPVTAEAVG